MAARPANHNTTIDPSHMGTPNPPTLDPISGRLWLHASPVKLETLNAFYGHSRSFAHPKLYIKNDQRENLQPCIDRFIRKPVLLGKSRG